MDKTGKNIKRAGWQSYLVALMILFGIGSFFFPVLGLKTAEGSVVLFQSSFLYFGGLQESVVDGANVSFGFAFNYYFLALLLLAFLAFLAVLFGRNTPQNLATGLVLLAIVIGASFLAPYFCVWTNPSIPMKGMEYQYGLFVSCAFFLMAFICLLPLLLKSRRFWRERHVK